MQNNQPFEVALVALKQGHDIARAGWNYTLRYLDGKAAKIKDGKVINPNWNFSIVDSFAEDWEVPELEAAKHEEPSEAWKALVAEAYHCKSNDNLIRLDKPNNEIWFADAICSSWLVIGLEDLAEVLPQCSADALYTLYCKAVGGVAFNGDPLPDWATFSSDPSKEKQVNAWRAVGCAACGLELVPQQPAVVDKVTGTTTETSGEPAAIVGLDNGPNE